MSKANSTTPRTLWGSIDADGNIVSSSGGFTIDKLSDAGQYKIRFNDSFSERPALVGTQNNAFEDDPKGQSPSDGLVFPAVDRSEAYVTTGDSNGNRVHRPFGFMAIGD